MKKKITKLFIIGIVILVIVFLFGVIYRSHVFNNLERKQKAVKAAWIKLYTKNSYRSVLFKEMSSNNFYKDILLDSMLVLIESNHNKINIYSADCTLEYVKYEYDLNSKYLNLITKYKNDSLFWSEENINLLAQLKINGKEANLLIDKYNQATLDYNKYMSTFPNFIFAKQGNFKKKKFFSIKFGIQNYDPVIKSKEIPEWAQGVDTL